MAEYFFNFVIFFFWYKIVHSPSYETEADIITQLKAEVNALKADNKAL
jgi:hypothetical protein